MVKFDVQEYSSQLAAVSPATSHVPLPTILARTESASGALEDYEARCCTRVFAAHLLC